jgi:hypothetical protein
MRPSFPHKGSASFAFDQLALLASLLLYLLAFLVCPGLARRLSICPPEPPPERISSPRDVILLYATGFHSGLELALRSLNATGCLARTVLFTSPGFRVTVRQSLLLDSLGVESVRDCGALPNQRYLVPHMTRFRHEFEWLTAHADQVDRVLHSDAYDIYFQSDPFADVIRFDSLGFVIEPHFIRGCGWNLNWFQQCFGTLAESFKDNFIICSGSIGGNAEYYRRLVGLMLNLSQWQSCYGDSKDQPILNYLVWSGAVRKAGIKYRFTGCDAGMMTMQWCTVNQVVRFNDKGQVLSPSNRVPAYLHQYPRIDGLTEILFKAWRLPP